MTLLIVESNPELSALWRRHVERQGRAVLQAGTQTEAIQVLQTRRVAMVVLDVELEEGSDPLPDPAVNALNRSASAWRVPLS